MKKSMAILVFSAVLLTGCGGAETREIEIPAVTTETVFVTETARTAAAITTEKPQETTAVQTIGTTAKTAETALISETREQTQTVTEGTQLQAEKPQENTIAIQEESPKIVQNPAVTTAPVQTTTAQPTATSKITTVQTTTTVPMQSEEETWMAIGSNLSHDGTDYGKALAVYEYMTANGSGTCVNYVYQISLLCKGVGLVCYFAWTPSQLYGHVANVVKVGGTWYVLDAQAGCFLTENLCGFTEIVDENERFISDASLISEIRYDPQ